MLEISTIKASDLVLNVSENSIISRCRFIKLYPTRYQDKNPRIIRDGITNVDI